MWAMLGPVEIALEKIKSREETQQSGIQKDDRDASHLQHLSLLFRKAVIIVPVWQQKNTKQGLL